MTKISFRGAECLLCSISLKFHSSGWEAPEAWGADVKANDETLSYFIYFFVIFVDNAVVLTKGTAGSVVSAAVL